MNVFKSEKYQDILTEAGNIDTLWRIKVDDLRHFIVKVNSEN